MFLLNKLLYFKNNFLKQITKFKAEKQNSNTQNMIWEYDLLRGRSDITLKMQTNTEKGITNFIKKINKF